MDRFLHAQIIQKSISSMPPRSWALLAHSQHSGVQCGWDQHLFPLWDGEEKNKNKNCRLYSVPFMGDLSHYLPRKVIEVPSSVPHSTFPVPRRRRNICSITTCSIAQGTTESGAVGEGWGVRSEDDFLGSCSWVIAYQFILLSRTGSGKKFSLMVSHVTIRNRDITHTHEECWRSRGLYH